MSFDNIDHFVVLMEENRSFDSLLGYLYEPEMVPAGQRFEGVAGKDLSNPIPPEVGSAQWEHVNVRPGYTMDNPNPDPGEEYPHVNTQLFGTVFPADNARLEAPRMKPPYNLPDKLPSEAPMSGFVLDYINNYRVLTGTEPRYANYRIIMDCFPPDAVPVMSTLARGFAVCDHWHCEVPSQTFPNRLFFNAGQSSGLVINEPYSNWVRKGTNNAQTIFERLESKGLSWKVYYDPQEHLSLTAILHFPRLWGRIRTNFCYMSQFFEDAKTGNLPHYAFIEPRLFVNNNDMHPPTKVFGRVGHSSVLAGEALIATIYNAIRLSDSPTGSNYLNTALLITFDEHGGCYDHIPPPAATPPQPDGRARQMDFEFDRLGVRVPAITVSAYTAAGTVINTPLQHTSFMRTLEEKWSLGHLTERDRLANDLREAFNLSQPRLRDSWPILKPRLVPQADTTNDDPLNPLQRHIVELVKTAIGEVDVAASEVRTVGEAASFLRRKAEVLR
jgi:phospholipase C